VVLAFLKKLNGMVKTLENIPEKDAILLLTNTPEKWFQAYFIAIVCNVGTTSAKNGTLVLGHECVDVFSIGNCDSTHCFHSSMLLIII
jgi:hypothetical protein